MEICVRSGDTLDYYSHLFTIPFELILDSNPSQIQTSLNASEMINIPGFLVKPYIIKEGETISEIAASKKLSADAILLLNQDYKAEEIKAGDTILLPVRKTKPLFQTKSPCDSEKLGEYITRLKKVYPFIIVSTVGTSVLGSPIKEIKIGKGKKIVHMNASFRANEWITTMVLMSLVNNYLLSLTNGSLIRGEKAIQQYQDVQLSIVPMVNPDGVDLVLNGPPSLHHDEVINMNEGSNDFIHWKANIRGVDLNRQFPANWEKVKNSTKHPNSPAPRDFPGSSSLSEPEAIAMAELTKSNHFDRILAFHTQGKEFYWGYEGHEPIEAEEIAKEIERVSGYQAIRYVDSHAGYKDWYIQEFKRPGFTLEFGWGINPLPLSQFAEILKIAKRIFIVALTY